MRKKPVITIASEPATIHGLSHEGIGIASVEGKVTFIEGALPEERVKYRVFKKRRHYDEGAVETLLNTSPERAKPACAHFGTCGGCSMQHLEENAQIQWKQKILLEQLERLGQVKPEAILPPLAAAAWGYRHKARLGVRYLEREQKILVGFRQKFRHGLADLKTCEVLHPRVGHKLPALSALIEDLDAKNQLPQIEVAIGDEIAALIFRHLEPLSPGDLEKFRAFGAAHDFHIYLQPGSPDSVSCLWPNAEHKRLGYRLDDFKLELLFHPLDFTQIHPALNRLMIKQALTLLDPHPNEQVLDLFCGIGNFSLPLATRAQHVVGIEGSTLMTERAYENANHNQITNVEFYAANLFDEKPTGAWFQKTYDKILVDPPRSGAQEIIAHFPTLAPQRIVYVSCNPATLARDAHILVHQQGYRLTQAGSMNMFPHTSHVEAMAVFERG